MKFQKCLRATIYGYQLNSYNEMKEYLDNVFLNFRYLFKSRCNVQLEKKFGTNLSIPDSVLSEIKVVFLSQQEIGTERSTFHTKYSFNFDRNFLVQLVATPT